MKFEKSAVSTISCCLFIFLLCADSFARLVPQRDPREGVLDASLVTIVRPETQDWFRIDEVFLGDQSAGSAIRLPGFRLYTVQEHGPELVEPMIPDTRVLLFLRSKADGWEVTHYGYCFFWRHEPEKVKELREMADKAVSLRRSWETARDTPDEQSRVETLWPYLWGQGVSFLKHTERELQKIGSRAGDYIAQQLEAMSHSQRMTILPNLGAYRSVRSHQALIRHLKSRRQLYESYLAERRPGAESLIEDWNHAPKEIKEIYGELYYGLGGLAGFNDRADLPFIRELAQWAAERRLKQTCDAALSAFRTMPDEANLLVVDAIWREFSARQFPGNKLMSLDVVRVLHTHIYPESVPLLVGFLKDMHAGREAHAALMEITEQDFGRDQSAWLTWYTAQKNEKNAVPIIRFDKSRFALGEAVFFWVGIEASSRAPIPKLYRKTCYLTITRPDGTSTTEPSGWPADGNPDSGWLGGAGLGDGETQLGRYTLVFEFAGLRTPPAFLFVEDVPILRQIQAEFVFSRSADGYSHPEGNVTLTIHNNSDQVLQFPRPNDSNSLVSFSLIKADGSFRGAYFYPPDKQSSEGNISFDIFSWDIAPKVSSVILRPGETFRKEMPLKTALEIAGKSLSVSPGKYDISFDTNLQVLIGEKDGKWSDISPVRIRVAATAGFVIAQ
jgi:hypothetical protein